MESLTPEPQQPILLNRINNLHNIPRRKSRPDQLTPFLRFQMLIASLSDQRRACPLPTQRHFIRWAGEFFETGLVEAGEADGVIFITGEGKSVGCSSVFWLDAIYVHAVSRLTVGRWR